MDRKSDLVPFAPGLDKVGDAAERHSRRCHCRSLQSQQPQSGSNCPSRLRGSAGLRLRYRPALLPQPWQTAESLFQKVSARDYDTNPPSGNIHPALFPPELWRGEEEIFPIFFPFYSRANFFSGNFNEAKGCFLFSCKFRFLEK